MKEVSAVSDACFRVKFVITFYLQIKTAHHVPQTSQIHLNQPNSQSFMSNNNNNELGVNFEDWRRERDAKRKRMNRSSI